MMEKKFCNDGEFLLFVDKTECDGKLAQWTLENAVEVVQDDTQKILRMDQCNWSVDDVTEEVAAAWLKVSGFTPDNKNWCPDFVANSEAWDNYVEDYLVQTNSEYRLTDFEYGVGRYAQ